MASYDWKSWKNTAHKRKSVIGGNVLKNPMRHWKLGKFCNNSYQKRRQKMWYIDLLVYKQTMQASPKVSTNPNDNPTLHFDSWYRRWTPKAGKGTVASSQYNRMKDKYLVEKIRTETCLPYYIQMFISRNVLHVR